jgi:hypothetical protein
MRRALILLALPLLLAGGGVVALAVTGTPTVQTYTYVIPAETHVQTVTVPTVTETVTTTSVTTTTVPATTATTTTNPTTTTTPPPTGTTLFTGDFETGDISQWNWGGQCYNTGLQNDTAFNRGTVLIKTAYAQQGAYGARFTLNKDNSKPQACEVLEHRPLVIDTYYGLVVKVISGTTNAWGTATAQFEYQGITGPPEGLFIENSTTESEAAPNAMLMAIQTGHCNQGGPCDTVGSRYDTTGGVTSRQYAVPPGAFVVGTAYEIICHIHFAFDTTGIYECWYRVKGTTAWTLGGRYSGVPTVQWTSTPHMQPEDVSKIGAYRPADGSSQWIVDLDGFTASTTFDSAANSLP